MHELLGTLTERLTELTPMKFNRGFAPDMRNMACMRPSMLPITNADEAEGICLLRFSILSISKLAPLSFVWYWSSHAPDRENTIQDVILAYNINLEGQCMNL